MKTITVRILEQDKNQIEKNLDILSRSLGRKINLSDLVRHTLKNVTSKQDLFNLNYISYAEFIDNSHYEKLPLCKSYRKNILHKS